MLGKYKITINFEIEKDTTPNENPDFDSEIDSEFGSDSDDYLYGCRCESCNSNLGDSDLDGSNSDNSDSNEDDLDYDKYYSEDAPTGWSYEDQQEYNSAWEDAVKNRGEVFDKGTVLRDRNGRFIKGNAPINQKRDKNGRFC